MLKGILNRVTCSTIPTAASRWLQGFLEPDWNNGEPLWKHKAFMDTLIVVTFDESYDTSPEAGNHIYTVFLGSMVQHRPEGIPDNYNHYNVLRTIEENFG